MRIAVCYSGKMGKNFEQCFQHHMAILNLNNHETDYFLHISNVENLQANKNFIESVVKPKHIQVSAISNNNNKKAEVYYGVMKVNFLKCHQEQIMQKKYDSVIRLGYDTGIEQPIHINSNELLKLNVLNTKYFRGYDVDIYDLLAFSNSETMDIYASCYNYLDIYSSTNRPELESIGEYHLKMNNIVINKMRIDSYLIYDNDKLMQNISYQLVNGMISIPKICMVVAFYFGDRTNNSTIHNLMEIQKRFLSKYKNNISRVVFAIAEDNRNDVEIKEIYDETYKMNITYMYKQNNGLSFGSWNTVVNHYRNEYDYYIFSEDDYVFCMDYFDRILVNEYNNQRSPYLVTFKLLRCNLLSTIGIISSKELEKIGYFNGINWTMDKEKSMRDFLNAFSSYNCIGKSYSAFPYWGNINGIWDVWIFDYMPGESFENYNQRVLLSPIQYIDEHDNLKPVNYNKILYQTFHIEQQD